MQGCACVYRLRFLLGSRGLKQAFDNTQRHSRLCLSFPVLAVTDVCSKPLSLLAGDCLQTPNPAVPAGTLHSNAAECRPVTWGCSTHRQGGVGLGGP